MIISENDWYAAAEARAAIILQHISESAIGFIPLGDLLGFRVADLAHHESGRMKDEARLNCLAVELLLRREQARLWVTDEWVSSASDPPHGAFASPVEVAGSFVFAIPVIGRR